MHHLELVAVVNLVHRIMNLLDIRCPLDNPFFLQPRSYFTIFIRTALYLGSVEKRISSLVAYTQLALRRVTTAQVLNLEPIIRERLTVSVTALSYPSRYEPKHVLNIH